MKKQKEQIEISVFDYAISKGKSVQWAYNQVENGSVKSKKIGKTIIILLDK